MPNQINTPMDFDTQVPWYQCYRLKFWYKFILKGHLTNEQLQWLIENIGQYDKKWTYDTRMDGECFAVAMEMMDELNIVNVRTLASNPRAYFPTRLYFKHDNDKLLFLLRWL